MLSPLAKRCRRCALPPHSKFWIKNPTWLTPQPQVLDCGGKRSATPLLDVVAARKAVSPLRSATALQILDKESNMADAATAGFGLRREAKRHAAFGCCRRSQSGVAAALCHRTPNFR